MDDEIEINDLIDDEEEEESTDEETSPDVDGETVPDEEFDGEADADNEPTIVIDDSTSGGQGGDVHPIVPDDPAPVFETTTRTIYFYEPITDYSSASLAAYEADGAVPVAILDDGTERTVTWSDVFDPRPQPVSATYVNEAAAVAAATNQHFWSRATDPDQDGAGTGAFVTDDEQDDFLAAAAQGFPDWGDGTQGTKPWHNLLMNSVGILLRTALNNLVSITRSAIAFFDGTGNQAANVVASFGKDGAQIGPSNNYRTEFNRYGMSVAGSESIFEVSSAEMSVDTHSQWAFSQLKYSIRLDGSGIEKGYIFELPSGIKAKSDIANFEWADGYTGIGTAGNNALQEDSTSIWYTKDYPVTAQSNFTRNPSTSTPNDITGLYLHDLYGLVSQYFPNGDPRLSMNAFRTVYEYTYTDKPHMRFGEGTLSASDNQAVLGRYNAPDTDDTYAVIVGNGDDDSNRSNALTVDWDGNVECNEVNGLALQSMGEMREASGTASVETETNRNVASIRLPPGTWLANARLQYPSNATGRRGAKLSMTSEDSGNPMSADVRTAVSGGTTQVQTERVFAITDSDVEGEADGKAPVYLIAWQNSGSTLLCAGSIQAVRLSPAIGESYDGGGGGSGGTTDYDDLTDKPAINGVTLVGDKSFAQLGMDFAGSPSSGGNAIRTNAILYGTVDSTSTATAFTATVAGLTQLQDGTCVMLKNGVVTSAAGFTIDVNNLGAKPVYTNLAAATAESTKFNVNYTLLFVYDSMRVSGGCWVCYNGYDSNTNTIGYQLRTNNSAMAVSDGTARYRLFLTSANGAKWVPINTSTSTNATTVRALNSRPIDPFGEIVYRSTNGAVAAGDSIGSTAIWHQYNITIGYSYVITLTQYKPVYLKCAPQSDGSAIMEGIVQALPTAADGKIYIFLGTASGTATMELHAVHPVYCYHNGALRKWTGGIGDYTGDEALPDEVDGEANPSKNILVDNSTGTIQANLLTAAQAAALFT